MRLFTWHTHGRYLQSLSNLPHDIFVPMSHDRSGAYVGRGNSYRLPSNVYEVPAQFVQDLDLDCVIFQTRTQYEVDQYSLLSDAQRAGPRIYIEHDPPLEHPADTRHHMRDGDVLLVHVTAFNQLMWNSPGVRSVVIDHGVQVPPAVRYTGELDSGIAAVNNIATRGRRLGLDVLKAVQAAAPVHVVGMGSDAVGGPGEVPPLKLAEYESHYRFFLNPMRWTSLSMAVCEAMLIGMPILGLATTEMVTVVRNGIEGYLETDVEKLGEHARRLINEPAEAAALGAQARDTALSRFTIERFVADWEDALAMATGETARASAVAAAG
jgi:glycosyltransferase involved in cell wall biosynthesis